MRKLADDEIRHELDLLERFLDYITARKYELNNELALRAKRMKLPFGVAARMKAVKP